MGNTAVGKPPLRSELFQRERGGGDGAGEREGRGVVADGAAGVAADLERVDGHLRDEAGEAATVVSFPLTASNVTLLALRPALFSA